MAGYQYISAEFTSRDKILVVRKIYGKFGKLYDRATKGTLAVFMDPFVSTRINPSDLWPACKLFFSRKPSLISIVSEYVEQIIISVGVIDDLFRWQVTESASNDVRVSLDWFWPRLFKYREGFNYTVV